MNFLISKEKREVVSINEEIYSGIIVIDPGHGGEDTGAISQNNVNEKDVVLDISLKLGEKLEENNFKVYFTRKSDKALGNTVRSDIINRAKFINARNADIFLSIHLNGSDVESAKGVESYSRFLDDKSYLLAESIQDELSSIEYTKDRGIKETNEKSLGILRYTNITGVLLELGFITNSEDEKYLISEEGQDIIVYCILNGILNYFNEIK
ncbi:N-acetylmuramoyl-L-alanine amidase family protein [Candidatus Arthromitus sp. SFB-turkey]|uniref:N-acetylmuramoyl-L-alanine amidase family protein n=1 Tax=Candidatus Arthromitus sp. SFB-turkey TaxID=1840217 RepID=UPI000AC0C44F|nr:N-acetylmuramoyl-L-alanine amidase [Candidatus Arthromitus sp. SFB-turkey]